MKVFVLFLLFVSAGCNNNGKTDTKLDSLTMKIDTTADKIADSVQSKSERLLKRIEERVEGRKDSSGLDSIK